jgi:hypothetical protein
MQTLNPLQKRFCDSPGFSISVYKQAIDSILSVDVSVERTQGWTG